MTLKELRISKGFSQQNAANLLNMPLRTYKRYELEKAYENSYKYKAIFNALKLIEKKHKKLSENVFSKICIIGGGHVGLSIGKVLARKYNVQIVDIDHKKVELINKLKLDNLVAVGDLKDTSKFEVAIICLPTNFNEDTKCYDTKSIEENVKTISENNPAALIVIKSTIGIGFTESLQIKNEIIYAPEFLREKTAFEDALNPDRLVVGCSKISPKAYKYASTIESVINIPRKTIFMSYKEAEAVKLYSNAYLAMRIAFFNDLDTTAMKEDINTKKVIKAMGLDPRIGDYYNNPSFFYSGYCLPKDARALSNLVDSDLINAIVSSNENRKDFIVKTIIEEARKRNSKPTIGIYNLDTESNGEKYHQSSSFEILEILRKYPVKVVVFDKNYQESVNNFEEFCNASDLIISNTYDDKLETVKTKLFTRDLLSKR
ncbi:MAG: UDP-glucose/GDP-mannose dehydrogenase family protein [Firmicutes bacterium]|nr:UDP-glucose/GDP-mannose dehydrogenase family protein [Candidatus Fiminaster equi]